MLHWPMRTEVSLVHVLILHVLTVPNIMCTLCLKNKSANVFCLPNGC